MTVRHLPKIITSIKPKYSLSIIPILAIVTIFALATHASTPNTSGEAESGTLASCASSINDSSASNSKAVQFGNSCSGSTTPPLSLDATGATIPDTDYAIPAGAIFMATNGDDSNAGTQSAPVATLAKAVSLVPTGGTVVAKAGVYHGGEIGTSKYFTLQAYPHSQVWFDGTQTIPTGSWTSDGSGHWYTDWETPSFCGGKYYTEGYNDQTTPTCSWGSSGGAPDYGTGYYAAATDPQMLFTDGNYTHEVTSLSAVGTGTANFFYDQMGTHRLYIGFNPSGHTVAATKWANALQLQNGSAAGSMTIRGVGFRRYGDDIYGANVTHGIILMNMPNSVVENDVFTQGAGVGIAYANTIGATIKNSVFAFNGFNGVIANGHAASGGPNDNMVIEGNVINNNNNEHYGCGYACSISNIKLEHMLGATVKNNIFENGQGGAKGFWCDNNCSNVTVVDNISRNNDAHGIFYEVSDTGIIASNLIYNNGGYGIKLGSANTKVYNNTLVNNNINLMTYDDHRTPSSQAGPNTTNDQVVNNVFYDTNGTINFQTLNLISSQGAQNAAESYFSSVNYDAYYRANDSPAVLVDWRPTSGNTTYSSASQFKSATGFEANALDITSGSDPFFTDLAGGNYNIRSSSPSYHSGTSLPSNVANAVGVSTSAGQNRGALIYPGSN